VSQATTLSHAVLSAHSVPVVLLPQEAKDTATIAAKTKANFFIFFLIFSIVKQSLFPFCGAKVQHFLIPCIIFYKYFSSCVEFLLGAQG
jgi:hypothetical protein